MTFTLYKSTTKPDMWICVPKGLEPVFCLWTYIPFIK